jgi:hypothetical protein
MTRGDLDLSSTSVFLDFDGTISLADTGVHLLNRLVGDAWHGIEELYTSGEIGSRECLVRQWALLPTGDEDRLRSVAAEVPVDPYFEPLVDGPGGRGGRGQHRVRRIRLHWPPTSAPRSASR